MERIQLDIAALSAQSITNYSDKQTVWIGLQNSAGDPKAGFEYCINIKWNTQPVAARFLKNVAAGRLAAAAFCRRTGKNAKKWG